MGAVQGLDGVLDKKKVVVDAAFFNEGALTVGGKGSQLRGQPQGKDLRENLGHAVNQADGSVVADPRSVRLLGEQNNVGGVEEVHAVSPQVGHPHNGRYHVALDGLPAGFEEGVNETVRAGILDRGDGKHGLPDLRLREISVKGGDRKSVV